MLYHQATLFAAFNAFNANKLIAAHQKTSMRLNEVPIQYTYKRPGLAEIDVPVEYFYNLMICIRLNCFAWRMPSREKSVKETLILSFSHLTIEK